MREPPARPTAAPAISERIAEGFEAGTSRYGEHGLLLGVPIHAKSLRLTEHPGFNYAQMTSMNS